jgi:hypothetical protein
MRRGNALSRWSLALPLAAGLWACCGCATIRRACVFTYDRINDTGDMIDLGVTTSGKSSLSIYACGVGLFTVGGGTFDGYYTGLGGGRVGIMRHYHKTVGLVVYSFEEYAWGEFDRSDPETLNRRHVGLIGWIFFPRNKKCSGLS